MIKVDYLEIRPSNIPDIDPMFDFYPSKIRLVDLDKVMFARVFKGAVCNEEGTYGESSVSSESSYINEENILELTYGQGTVVYTIATKELISLLCDNSDEAQMYVKYKPYEYDVITQEEPICIPTPNYEGENKELPSTIYCQNKQKVYEDMKKELDTWDC